MMTTDDLREYLETEAEYSHEEVANMSGFEMFSKWLEWNGLIGYSFDIAEIMEAITGVDICEF